MAKISYSSQAIADLERICNFFSDDSAGAQLEEALELIEEAVVCWLAIH